MHETATDLVRELVQQVPCDKDKSRLMVSPYEATLKTPLNCCVGLPGRSVSPAIEMIGALQVINQVWDIVQATKILLMAHPFGHVEVNESVMFDHRQGVVTCYYSSLHFELSKLSLVVPSFLQILLARELDAELGHLRVNAPLLSRDKSMFAVEPVGSVEYEAPRALTNNNEKWLSENKMFCEEGPALGYTQHFFRKVAGPLARSHALSDTDHDAALQSASECAWAEWAAAQVHWLETGNA